MMSSNHKVLPLGKHKLGIAGNQESLGIPGNREYMGMPRGMGNAQAIGNTGNAGECVCVCGNTGNVGNLGNTRGIGNPPAIRESPCV